MIEDFENINYLNPGNKRQQQVFSILTKNHILDKLKRFDPVIVGTIPINIDIENSDIDIACFFTDKYEFQRSVADNFYLERGYTIREKTDIDPIAVVCSFFIDDFEIEIFGQNIPTKQQLAYRHMIIEHKLLNQDGEAFRQEIIELKRQGYKTEPAFALVLGLMGDPYIELLKFETKFESK